VTDDGPALSRRRGLVELVASSILFGVMAWLARRVTTYGVSAAQVAFLRFAFVSIVVLVGAAAGRVVLLPRRADLLLVRAIFGSFAVLLYFMTLAHLPAGTSTLLYFSSPIWSTLLAAIFLREHPRGATVAALAVACGGVVLVVVGQGKHLGGSWTWLGVGVLSAALSGAALVGVRAARRYNSAWTVLAVFFMVGAICTAPPAVHAWSAITPGAWWICLGIAVVSLAAQLLMTNALGAVQNATAGALGLLTVITAMAMGYAFDGERLSGLSAAGALLVLGGIILSARVSDNTNTR
jgi:drug/metabolite transporter (DMT)-like permease